MKKNKVNEGLLMHLSSYYLKRQLISGRMPHMDRTLSEKRKETNEDEIKACEG
jgi:hypothetical protein